MNGLALSTLLLGLLDRAAQIQALLVKTRAEGRDPTAEELDALFADDAAARAQLQAEIDRQRGG
jgi:hypothetical protein